MSAAALVLVVEDDPDVRDVVMLVLSLHGYSAAGATDGADAWARLKEGPRPALVVLDLRMPRLDGSDLVRLIQGDKDLRDIPLVVMSGEILGRQEATALGVAAFLEKPVGLRDLLDTVGRFAPAPTRNDQ